MSDDPDALTYRHVGLVIQGVIYVPYPPGSYGIRPDTLIPLGDVLRHAFAECGISEDKIDTVCDSARSFVEPRFAAEVDRFEKIRQDVLADEPDE